MMKLYYAPGACSMAVHITLHETGLPFQYEPVNLQTMHYKGGDFRKINPKEYVPVLQLENGELLTEDAIILQYLADRVPDKQLIPRSGTMERYRCQEWLNFIATEIHKGFTPLFIPDAPEKIVELAKGVLAMRFSFVAQKLEGKSYLMGNYTVADAYLFTILNWTNLFEIDLSPWPALAKYMDVIRARPTTQSAMKEEGLIKAA